MLALKMGVIAKWQMLPIAAAALSCGLALGAPQTGRQHNDQDVIEQLMQSAQLFKARGKLDISRKIWRKILAIVPDHPQALAELNQKKATPVIAADSTPTPQSKSEADHRMQTMLDQLAARLQTEEPQAVLASIDHELTTWPNARAALGRLAARAYDKWAEQAIQTQQWDSALHAWQEALRLTPTDPWLRLRLAKLLSNQGQEPKATQLIHEGLALNPDVDMHHAGALYFSALGQIQQAYVLIDALPLTQRSTNLRQLHTLLTLKLELLTATQAAHQGQQAQIQAHLDRALTLAANNPEHLLEVAQTMAELDKKQAASSLLLSWLQAHPEHTQAAQIELKLLSLLQAADQQAALLAWFKHKGWMQESIAKWIDTLTQSTASHAWGFATVDALAQLTAQRSWSPEQQQRLNELWINSLEYVINAQLVQKQFEPALALLQGLPASVQNTPAMLVLAMRTHLALRQGAVARQLFVQLRDHSTADADSQLTLLRAWRSLGEELGYAPHEKAQLLALAQTLHERHPERADVTFVWAQTQRTVGAWKNAKTAFTLAKEQAQTASSATSWVTRESERQLDQLEQRQQITLNSGVFFTHKPGDPVSSTLDTTEEVLLWRVPLGEDGHFFVHAGATRLRAGSADLHELAVNADFGTGPLHTTSTLSGTTFSATSQGTAVLVGYENDSLYWDIGTTPIGFAVTNWVGSVRLKGEHPNWQLELARRPVTGSLIAYAGQRDPYTNQIWGGVIRTSVSASNALKWGAVTPFAQVDLASYNGLHVQSNRERGLRLGASIALQDRDDRYVGISPTLQWQSFAHNQNHYTFGHGGYYSPQNSINLSMPLQVVGRSGAWNWSLRAALSASYSRSDANDFFPTRPDYQQQALALGTAQYAASSGPGKGRSWQWTLQRQLSPHWSIGTRLGMDRSQSYSYNQLIFYLRFSEKVQRGVLPLWPSVVSGPGR